ncbi:MAG: hypothetical protein IKR26_00755 [Lachnospiraceae bacterium]|nr:hypothetical protein [Lachnospiraceae bacterium]
MKKLLAMILAAVLALGLVACGEETETTTAPETESVADPSRESESTPEATEPQSTTASAVPQTVIKVRMGDTYKTDLDGDGTEDEVLVNVKTETVQGDGYSYDETKWDSFEINGKKMIDAKSDEPFAEFQIWYEYPAGDYYYITDLDVNDGVKEIAVVDNGSNDWTVTTFFRYAGGKLNYLGYMESSPDSDNFILFGNGTAQARIHIQVFQTWNGVAVYEVGTDGKIALKKGQIIIPDKNDYLHPTIKKDLTVYSEMDNASATHVIKGDGSAVEFTQTDNEHWVKVETKNGESGWIYLVEWSQVDNGGTIEYSSDIFDDLLFAG